MILNLKGMSLEVNFENAEITSLKLLGKERLFRRSPLFKFNIRDKQNKLHLFTAHDAKDIKLTSLGAVYSGFESYNISAEVSLLETDGEAEWHILIIPNDNNVLIEWVDFPLIKLPKLRENNENGDGGAILFPYNEGVIISNNEPREKSWFKHIEPSYPSWSTCAIFPNMICSQMISYIFEDASLYIGAHDSERGVKQIDFYEEDGGIVMKLRLFTGKNFGESYKNDYPIVFSAQTQRWESSAERYRLWFEENLPPKAKKIAENENLPEWYADSPLVVTYPVRGIHDMDEMKPNKLFPYTNALPLLDSIKKSTGSRILALLMHWEGTAPWAPPYVWPPFGGVENFDKFADELHKRGDLLGVYCSGFSYTMKSNLLNYDKTEEFNRRGLSKAMCAGVDDIPIISHICTGQRSGYDICPASDLGKEIVDKAYTPLFSTSIDYTQVLDQNHGGGQYFCLSNKHGHPPTPGQWMTENMQSILSNWNEHAKDKLLGCESAAAEPFIGNLLYNDNRFELNYVTGVPVPLYAYIYHEYIRNFMGNQVCCPFPSEIDTLRFRLAYSFVIGDSMTLTLTPDGDLLSNWSTRDFEHFSDKEKTYTLIKNLTSFYTEKAKKYLYNGKMIPAKPIECDTISYPVINDFLYTAKKLHTAAYEAFDGTRAQILVNPWDEEVSYVIDGERQTILPLCAKMILL